MNIPNSASVTRAAGRAVLQFKKASPNLMFGFGLGAVAVGAVMACRATLKLEDIVIESQVTIESINNFDYENEHTAVQDKALVYSRLAYRVTKLYAPAVAVGAVGVICLTGSHTALTRRNAALTAAYAGLERSYDAYRRRVEKELGAEKERELHYEVVKEQAQKKAELDKAIKNPGESSIYARFFDEAAKNWKPISEYNMIFLRVQQTYANDLLNSRGHIFLNEVYDMIGVDRSRAGSVVGWIRGHGDSYVDFGIFNGETMEARNFVNGAEKSILLDFNVDGVIYDKI